MSEATETTSLYRHRAADGELLYVGISLHHLERLRQHHGGAHWADQIARVEIETYPTREAALAAEREAIACENPKHNIVGACENAARNRAARRADQQTIERGPTVTLAEALVEFRQDAVDPDIATYVVRAHFGDLLSERLVLITPERLAGRDRMLVQTHGEHKARAAMVVLGDVLEFAASFYQL